jgi:hypothetical protein
MRAPSGAFIFSETLPKETMNRIKSVKFQDSDHRYGDKEAVATMDDESEELVFHWFSDELSFREEELVAMTIEQARDLRQERDIAYLRS